MDLRLLGPVEMWGEHGKVKLGTPRQRCVLAALAMAPGQPVTLSTLIDRVWAGQPPRNARDSIYSHISRLRAQVHGCGGRLVRRDGGYALEIDTGAVDLHRMRDLAARARAACTAGDDAHAAQLLQQACELWRGTALAGLPGDWADRVRSGLDQERLALLTERFEVELRCGRHADMVGQLAAAQAEYPLAEPLAGLLMLALYRAGRQSEALAVYARARQDLIAAIGDEPAGWLQELHGQLLRRDPDLAPHPDLEPSAGQVRSGPPRPPVPAQLPPDVANFVGRRSELGLLDGALPAGPTGPPVVVALEGTAGVGKSALVVRWAHRVRAQFPDGQLYADLRGFAAGAPSSPLEVLARFLHSLGVPAQGGPTNLDEAVGMYRSLLADKRVLVVLDNATDPEQARPLLPSGAGSAAVVTSRDQLAGLVARDGAQRIVLDVLPVGDAAALLAELLGSDRVAAEPAPVAELAELCGHLPLALRVAAANLAGRPAHRIAAYVERLRASDRVRTLTVTGDAQSVVAAAFDLSYLRLRPLARRMFRLLGLVPGADLDVAAAAALAQLPPAGAAELLEELAAAHLVEERAAGRYGCHDLLRQYAADRALADEDAPTRQRAVAHLYEHYLRTVAAAVKTVNPVFVRLPLPERMRSVRAMSDAGEAMAWLDSERVNLVAAVAQASERGLAAAGWQLADLLRGYLVLTPYLGDWLRLAGAGMAAAAEDGHRAALAACRLNLAHIEFRRSRYRDAIVHATDGLADAAVAGWPEGQGALLNLLGIACWPLGELVAALDHLSGSAAIFEQLGWKHAVAALHSNLARVNCELGRLAEAADHARRGLAETRELAVPLGEVINLEILGEVLHDQGDLPAATEMYQQAHVLAREHGYRSGEGDSLIGLAQVHHDLGEHQRAGELARAGLRIARDHSLRRLETECLLLLAWMDRDAAGLRRVVELSRQTSNRYPETAALLGLASVLLAQGEPRQARDSAEQARKLARISGYRQLEAQAGMVLAGVCQAAGAIAEARAHLASALRSCRSTGYRLAEARCLLALGSLARDGGEEQAARQHWRDAQALFAAIGTPEADELATRLAESGPAP